MGLKKREDLLNLKKQQLIQDAAFLDKIINFDTEGKIQIKLEQGDYHQLHKLLKGNDLLDNSESDSSEAESGDEQSPTRSRRSNISSNKIR